MAKSLFDERHQLDGKQGIDDSGLEQILVVIQIRHADRAQNETLNGFLDAIVL